MALRQIENQFHGRLRSMVEQAYFPPFPLPVIHRERKREGERGKLGRNYEENETPEIESDFPRSSDWFPG